jgi:two-component system, chemotaxis family, sensor kinase CheA
MAKKPKSVESVEALENISAEILAIDPADKEALAQVGASLEQVRESLERDSAEAADLVELALEVLQGVFEETIPDASAGTGAVAEAVVAAGKALAGDDDALQQATATLCDILGQDDEAAPIDAEPDTSADTPEDPAEAPDNGPPRLPEDADTELMGDFIVECLDHISGGEAALLDLESNPDDTEQINIVFRAFHTIKGTSAFLGLGWIQDLAHLAESLLDRAREGEIVIQGGYADLSLKSCDALRSLIENLDGIEPGGEVEIIEGYDDLIRQLRNPDDVGVGEEVDTDEMRLGEILVGKGQVTREQVEQAVEQQGDQPIGKVLVDKKVTAASDVAKALRTQKKLRGGAAADSTIRVGTGRLDSLINMVGELVIAQSMVTQDVEVEGGRSRLVRNVSHAGKIVRELQDLTMSLRMVPLKGTFQKMARLVRDLAAKAGKSVQYVTEGEETEIDRNMVEVLNDPLVHMIRNAVDHGIEAADERAGNGKSPSGTVRLRAYHSAGSVVIELIDDGKGLNRERITAKALERGLIEPDQTLSDSEAFGLIFQAGFSTAEKITDVSGRGVGMDVVKTGIESLRGRIEVASQPGAGSTFTIRLPLTMAITDAMLLRVGREQYLLPTVSIEHSFRPNEGAMTTVTGQGEMVMLRGDLLPVFRLHTLFSVPDATTAPSEALMIAIEAEGKRCALMVDELLGQQQVVVKPLGRSLGQIPGVSGGSILGDGRVGLILDAGGLLKLAAA